MEPKELVRSTTPEGKPKFTAKEVFLCILCCTFSAVFAFVFGFLLTELFLYLFPEHSFLGYLLVSVVLSFVGTLIPGCIYFFMMRNCSEHCKLKTYKILKWLLIMIFWVCVGAEGLIPRFAVIGAVLPAMVIFHPDRYYF